MQETDDFVVCKSKQKGGELLEDEKILDLYWSRSESAIRETDIKYGPYCRTISMNILHSPQDAEECVNDTWFNAWNTIPPQRPGKFAAFLGKITRNLSLNRFKRDHTEKRGMGQTPLVLAELEGCLSSFQTVEQAIDEKIVTESIDRFLESLSPVKRKIFVCRYWYLSPVRDIARQYGMSESKVTSILFRLRGKLKVHLEKEGITL